jgi:hypothetical protein
MMLHAFMDAWFLKSKGWYTMRHGLGCDVACNMIFTTSFTNANDVMFVPKLE